MTPKEKSMELVNKFSECSEDEEMYIETAKKCALIAVDEIINECGDRCLFSKCDYWLNVKSEIEKL